MDYIAIISSVNDTPPHSGLLDALALDGANVPVVAIVGGGGKTTLLYRLGREAQARGLRTVLSGTARFTPDPSGRAPEAIVEAEPEILDGVRQSLERTSLVVAATARASQHRLMPLSDEAIAALAATDGVRLIALEADGSKMLPFKAPAEHEPAIPPAATHVVAVVGADAIDAPLDDEHVHRPERVRALLEPSMRDATTCSVEVIARALASAEGGRRGVGARYFSVMINKADHDPDGTRRLAEALQTADVPRVIAAELRDETDPVRFVLTSR